MTSFKVTICDLRHKPTLNAHDNQTAFNCVAQHFFTGQHDATSANPTPPDLAQAAANKQEKEYQYEYTTNKFRAAITGPAPAVEAAVAPNKAPEHQPSQAARQQFIADSGTKRSRPMCLNFFDLTVEHNRLPGAMPVVVKGKIRGKDIEKQAYLSLPGATARRLEAAIQGALTPGIVGLIEFALDELERQNARIVIENSADD